jgi:hypothetical protein
METPSAAGYGLRLSVGLPGWLPPGDHPAGATRTLAAEWQPHSGGGPAAASWAASVGFQVEVEVEVGPGPGLSGSSRLPRQPQELDAEPRSRWRSQADMPRRALKRVGETQEAGSIGDGGTKS